MSVAENGNTVRVHYTGKFSNGKVFDSSLDREPLECRIGEKQVIVGFEKAVTGMKTGEKKTVSFPPEDGYGVHRDELIFEVDNKELPEDFTPKIGEPLEMMNHQGEKMIVNVCEITDDGIKLDANHPLAGKHLTFDIELLEIQ